MKRREGPLPALPNTFPRQHPSPRVGYYSPVSSSEAHARELQLTVCILPPHFPATLTGAENDKILEATDKGLKVLLLKAPPRTEDRNPRLRTRTQCRCMGKGLGVC